MKIIVLGAGLVGRPMALDLSKEFEVTLVDKDKNNLELMEEMRAKIGSPSFKTLQADLSEISVLKNLITDYDFVLNALPGFLGYQTLLAVIESGKNIVDISFFPEDPSHLHEIALKNKVTAIMDCGVAPGMSNILTGYVAGQLDHIDQVLIYVGGLPVIRQWPWEYKAVFSPADVIEEYTRPARYVENGHIVIREALSDPEMLEFESVGTLEAFNSDGLRSLMFTIKAENMKEKTLRYAGHIEKIRVLRETGFFSKNDIDFQGVKISPLDFTSKILFPAWQLKKGEGDLTVMKIIIEGEKEGNKQRFTYDLYDTFDQASGIHSMARTTGYTATMAIRMLAKKLFTDKGLIYPEYLGSQAECVDFILNGLAERKVVFRKKIETIE